MESDFLASNPEQGPVDGLAVQNPPTRVELDSRVLYGISTKVLALFLPDKFPGKEKSYERTS